MQPLQFTLPTSPNTLINCNIDIMSVRIQDFLEFNEVNIYSVLRVKSNSVFCIYFVLILCFIFYACESIKEQGFFQVFF